MRLDLAKYTSIRIGPIVDVLILDEAIQSSDFILGGGNNLLISSKPPSLCKLGPSFDFIKILDIQDKDFYLQVGAACSNKKLFNFTKKHNLSGLECLAHIPGSVGGSLKMNAGLKDHSISKCLYSINQKKDFSFSYRSSSIKELVFEAVFKLSPDFDEGLYQSFLSARQNQPKAASFGSVFKNPANAYAGSLIEGVGLKGFSKGDAMFSSKHANFILNKKKASFEDVIFLIKLAKDRVYEANGILLEEEVIII